MSRPQKTEGLFFVDERLKRSNTRVDPSGGSVKAGVELRPGALRPSVFLLARGTRLAADITG